MPKMKYASVAQEWLVAYKAGENIHGIGRRYGVRYQTVHRYIRHHLGFKTKVRAARWHAINEHAFDDPNAPDAAYWLGFIFADGCVVETRSGYRLFSITLQNRDIEHLRALQCFLKTGNPIRGRSDKEASFLTVSSLPLVNRLVDLGVVPRKSLIVEYPKWLTPEGASHFVRGVFDGDGCIVVRNKRRYTTPQGAMSIVGSRHLMSGIASEIARATGIAKPKLSAQRNIFRIMVEGAKQVIAVREWLYRDATAYLPRKKHLFHSVVLGSCRNRTNIPRLTAFGETKTPADWCDDPRCTVASPTLRRRLMYGWSIEDAITKPSMRQTKIRSHG
jgi:hypothetical protein